MTRNERLSKWDNMSTTARKAILLEAYKDDTLKDSIAESMKNKDSLNLCWHQQQKLKQAATNLGNPL